MLVVLLPPLGPTSLFLFGHLGGPTSYFPSSGQGTMDFTSQPVAGYFQSGQNLHPTMAQGSFIF